MCLNRWAPEADGSVDLHLIPGASASAEERAAIDAAIAAVAGTGPGTRHMLLPALHAAQACTGWISEGALNHICAQLSVPPAEAYGVATFYHLFSTERQAPRVVHVCDDIACRVKGAEGICRSLEAQFGPAGSGEEGTWKRSPCLGYCEQAPVALVQHAGAAPVDRTITQATLPVLTAAVSAGVVPEPFGRAVPQADAPRVPALRLLRRVGAADPASLDDYRAHGGYQALRRALDIGPEAVLREITDSKLLGRGGAAFPTGRKWEAVARSPVRPHYLVCNADESEPGTFKDRVLMEEDPFALVEAMTIAGLAIGAEQGFIYIRGEYPRATMRLQSAIEQAALRGWLGDHIGGAGARFHLDLRRGAGAYICGEETSLFNSLEGFRGEPRNKPPFPVQSGLFHKPTVINNVETLVNVIDVVLEGGPAYAGIGTAASTGSKLFCLSGCVTKPGVYEVPFGITLRGLLDMAGGVEGGRPLQAILLGGAAGVFVTPDELDMPLTFEGTRAANATLGSGVVMVFDDRVDLGDILIRIASFFRDESCGQCVPCRIGTIRQEESLHRLVSARTAGDRATEKTLIADLARVMRDASICGLGQTAASAVESALKKFPLEHRS